MEKTDIHGDIVRQLTEEGLPVEIAEAISKRLAKKKQRRGLFLDEIAQGKFKLTESLKEKIRNGLDHMNSLPGDKTTQVWREFISRLERKMIAKSRKKQGGN